MKSFTIRKVTYEAPVLTLAQLTAAERTGVIQAVNDGIAHTPAYKIFCKAILQKASFDALCVAAPASWGTVARSLIAVATGGIDDGGMELFEFDENGVPAELAEAYIKHAADSQATYGEDSPLARVFAIRVRADGRDHLFIMRYPNERDVDAFVKDQQSHELAKAFCVATCVHGNMAVLEAVAPFYYITITRWMLGKAGAAEIELAGE